VSDRKTYDLATRLFHWAIAGLFITTVPLGLWAANIGPQNPSPDLRHLRDQLLVVHKSIGILILLLAVPRLIWAMISIRPGHLPGAPAWEWMAAKSTHGLLYLLMLGLPITGIYLSQAAGFPVSLFGILQLPRLVEIDPAIPLQSRPEVMMGVLLHKQIFTITLYLAFGLHVVGLLKHLIIDRDAAAWRRIALKRRATKGIPTTVPSNGSRA